ncbi:hypothetical protein RIR_jg34531.t1 [Rhizophagus irregularis DAOM 181602=DAOM 197198]|nr:hypothetical protein RIR_jg34531.t1 [Rhizophagus irregularis DAOM 181602=DAOM 197198]
MTRLENRFPNQSVKACSERQRKGPRRFMIYSITFWQRYLPRNKSYDVREINVNSLVARIKLIAVSVISVVFEHFVLLIVVDAYTYVKVYLANK